MGRGILKYPYKLVLIIYFLYLLYFVEIQWTCKSYFVVVFCQFSIAKPRNGHGHAGCSSRCLHSFCSYGRHCNNSLVSFHFSHSCLLINYYIFSNCRTLDQKSIVRKCIIKTLWWEGATGSKIQVGPVGYKIYTDSDDFYRGVLPSY